MCASTYINKKLSSHLFAFVLEISVRLSDDKNGYYILTSSDWMTALLSVHFKVLDWLQSR